jgi:hypothetical protein
MRLTALTLTGLLLALPVSAQTPQPQVPEEASRLAFWAGTWQEEAPPGAQPPGTETCEPYGPLNIVCRLNTTDGGGQLTVLSYMPAARTFLVFAAHKDGESEVRKVRVAGKTWEWADNPLDPHGRTTVRVKFTETSPTSYDVTTDVMKDGKWQSTTTRVKKVG